MLSKEKKKLLYNALVPIHGEQEANNIVAYYNDAVTDVSESKFKEDIDKLSNGEPVQYVTNTSFFYGHQLYVDYQVLIPRPETEELVHWLITDIAQREVSILDIGTGSGCILLSVLHQCSHAEGLGIDIEEQAEKVYRRNAGILSVNAAFQVLDILNDKELVRLDKYDIIVSNPPYILEKEKDRMGESVIKHEPHEALYVDENDPLLFYKRIMRVGEEILKPNGVIYFETSDLYHEDLLAFVQNSTYEYEFKKDLQGNWRMLKLWIS